MKTSKKSHNPLWSLFPFRGAPAPVIALDRLYVPRPAVEAALTSALAETRALVLYGPSFQGKTTLINHLLGAEALVIECHPDFKRPQIYRVILSSLGYSVVFEKKKKNKKAFDPLSVDLKNATEVAHLIAQSAPTPWIVLNNFHLLDSGTQESLFNDLPYLTENPAVRIMLVGAWRYTPAIARQVHAVHVPLWTDDELRTAAAHFGGVSAARLEALLMLAGGDIGLFRALLDAADEESPQAVVLERFRRTLHSRLKLIQGHRDSVFAYRAHKQHILFSYNPAFEPHIGIGPEGYRRTTVNPATQHPYLSVDSVALDHKGNPQYLETVTGDTSAHTLSVVPFIFRAMHAAVHAGETRVMLDDLTRQAIAQLDPPPLAIDAAQLKSVIARFEEVQRQARIIPYLIALDESGEALEIVDRRLLLFLQQVSAEALLREIPAESASIPRRRNFVSAGGDED